MNKKTLALSALAAVVTAFPSAAADNLSDEEIRNPAQYYEDARHYIMCFEGPTASKKEEIQDTLNSYCYISNLSRDVTVIPLRGDPNRHMICCKTGDAL